MHLSKFPQYIFYYLISFYSSYIVFLNHFIFATPFMHFYFALMDQVPLELFVPRYNRLFTNCNKHLKSQRERERHFQFEWIMQNESSAISMAIYRVSERGEQHLKCAFQDYNFISYFLFFFLLCTNAATQKFSQK